MSGLAKTWRMGQRGGAAGRRRAGLLLGSCAALLLGGCAALPVSGPTGASVLHQVKDSASLPPGQQLQLVELSDAASLPQPLPLPPLAPARALLPSDQIGPGDVLDIQIYEAGVALFGGHAVPATGAGAGLVEAAEAAHMGAVRVDDEGLIRLPYAGAIRAAGQTPAGLAAAIRAALKGLSQNPQVVVGIAQPIANTVIVGGEVGRPGRLVLATNRESVSDVVALAGGYRGEAKDLALRLVRDGAEHEYRLSDLMSGPARDMRAAPGDRVVLVRAPESFSVMGAPGKVEQMAFPGGSVSLAEAVAMAGGAHPYLGDAKAIFVFRYAAGADGAPRPVVYHLDMMQAGAYFLAQRFAMRDKDLLYVGNAAANQPGKLIQLVSQLFSPIVAVESGLVSTRVLH